MTLYKEYTPHPDGVRQLRIAISFRKETYSITNGQEVERGYIVTVVPVKITRRDGITMEESGAFTGFNQTLIACDRQSKKKLQAAIDQIGYRREKYINYFREQNA